MDYATYWLADATLRPGTALANTVRRMPPRRLERRDRRQSSSRHLRNDGD